MTFFNDNPQQENTTQHFPEEAAFVDRFRAMMEGSADLFCMLTPRGEVQEISPSWHNFTGQEENEYRGRGWLEAFHPAEQPQVEEILIQAVISGRSSEHTRQVRRYDGSYRLIDWRLIPVRKPSGAVSELVAITSNTLKLSPQRWDLGSIVRETVEDVRVIAPDRSLELALPEGSGVCVLADRDRISQVLTNYVTNALRYSPPDQPVRIGMTVEGEVARVWVRDQGPGLSAEAQQEIWQRFHQVKGIPVQSGLGKGLGLGLYICKMLIDAHRGEVGVESTPGEGSTFWFTLPVVTSEDSWSRASPGS